MIKNPLQRDQKHTEAWSKTHFSVIKYVLQLDQTHTSARTKKHFSVIKNPQQCDQTPLHRQNIERQLDLRGSGYHYSSESFIYVNAYIDPTTASRVVQYLCPRDSWVFSNLQCENIQCINNQRVKKSINRLKIRKMSLQVEVFNWWHAIYYNKALNINLTKLALCLLVFINFFSCYRIIDNTILIVWQFCLTS